jgi:hypothetical protein
MSASPVSSRYMVIRLSKWLRLYEEYSRVDEAAAAEEVVDEDIYFPQPRTLLTTDTIRSLTHAWTMEKKWITKPP